MRTPAVLTATVLALLTVLTPVRAQVPQAMNYQVMLTDADDQPLPGMHTLVFSIYTADDGGSLLWTETQNLEANSIGVVSATLGSVTPIGIAFDAPRWLQVQVDGETLQPRRRLTTSPYAFHAEDSNHLGGADPSAYATDSELSTPGTINSPGNPVDWTKLKGVPAGFADGTDDGAGGSGDGHSLDADDGSPEDAVYVDSNGVVLIGKDTGLDGELEVYRAGVLDRVIECGSNADGGQIHILDEAGIIALTINGDDNGSGGRIVVQKDATPEPGEGIDLNGNWAGTGQPMVRILGDSQSILMNMSTSGDGTVILPTDAVSAAEVLDEPGVASNTWGTGGIALTGTLSPLLSRSIDVPATGFVLALASCQLDLVHTTGTDTGATLGVSDQNDAWPDNQDVSVLVSGAAETGDYVFPGAYHAIFDVSGPATHTFYLLGIEDTGEVQALDIQFSLIYFPTAYGTVAPPLAAGSAGADDETAARPPLTDAEIAAEKLEAQAFRIARLERELAEVRAAVAEMQDENGS